MTDSTRFRSAVPSLPVSDERRAVDFYRDALGLRELADGDVGLGILIRDEVELHLWVADGSAPGAETHLAGSSSCRIEATETDVLHEHCRALGVVHPNAPLRNTPWGTREFGVVDPDGNLVTLFQRGAQRERHEAPPASAPHFLAYAERLRQIEGVEKVHVSGLQAVRVPPALLASRRSEITDAIGQLVVAIGEAG